MTGPLTSFSFLVDSVFFFNLTASTEGPDTTKDTQKKKRKGRNKQETVSITQAETEPEAVKTPIDLMKVCVSTSNPALLSHM